MDDERIAERLAAVERAVSDGTTTADPGDAAATLDDADRDDRLDDLAERVAQLEAATQALRGYVGAVRSAEGDVADRADRALAAVSDLETRVAALEDLEEDPDSGGEQVDRRIGEMAVSPGDASIDNPADESRGGSDRERFRGPVGAETDPDWLARADERLPDGGETPPEASGDDDSGIAARIAGLL